MGRRKIITVKNILFISFLFVKYLVFSQQLVDFNSVFSIPIGKSDDKVFYDSELGNTFGPAAFTFDDTMNLYIVDEMYQKIKVFDNAGVFKKSIPYELSRSIEISRITIGNDGSFYLTSGRQFLIKYSNNGQQLFGINCKNDELDSEFIIAGDDLILGIRDSQIIGFSNLGKISNVQTQSLDQAEVKNELSRRNSSIQIENNLDESHQRLSNGIAIPQKDSENSNSALTENGEKIILNYTLNQQSRSTISETQSGLSLRSGDIGDDHSTFYNNISKGRYSNRLGQDSSGNVIWKLYLGEKSYIFKTSETGDLLDVIYYEYNRDDVAASVLAPDGYVYYLSDSIARDEKKLILKKIDYYLF